MITAADIHHKPGTSLVAVPCSALSSNRGRRFVRVENGTLWLRDNETGALTFVRDCLHCGAKHYPANRDKRRI